MDSPPPSREGTIPFAVPSLDEPCSTFYRIVGDLTRGGTPVVMLHGGPGAGHGVLRPFEQLWQRHGVPVVLYDQIGCGNSTHLRERAGDHAFWREGLFVAELDNLLDHLGLRDGNGFHLFGFSWGGMLAAAFATARPRGLRRLVLASGIASMELGYRSVLRWKAELPEGARGAVDDAVRTADFTGQPYREAMMAFSRLVLCRAEPFPPPEMLSVRKNQMEDPTVNKTMIGPSNFINSGSLREWTVIPRLHNISAPTLVYNGEFDSSDDQSCQPFFDLIPRVRWTTIRGAAHMCHLETPEIRERVLRLVGDFLTHENSAS